MAMTDHPGEDVRHIRFAHDCANGGTIERVVTTLPWPTTASQVLCNICGRSWSVHIDGGTDG